MGEYLSDRRRVELALPAALLYRIFAACMAHGAENPEIDESKFDEWVIGDLFKACHEPLDGLTLKRKKELVKRIERIQSEILTPFEDRPIMVCFLYVLFWLKELLDDGTLVLIQDSPFDRAITALIPELESQADLWDAMEKSARKQATKLTKILRSHGFYRG